MTGTADRRSARPRQRRRRSAAGETVADANGNWSLLWTAPLQNRHVRSTHYHRRRDRPRSSRVQLPRAPAAAVAVRRAAAALRQRRKVSTETGLEMTDRWRIAPPPYELDEIRGRLLDPYNKNTSRATTRSAAATPSSSSPASPTPWPSRARCRRRRASARSEPGSIGFFGSDDQNVFAENVALSFDLFQGDTAFKPVKQRIKATLIANFNRLHVAENAIVKPDVRARHGAHDGLLALQELFYERKLQRPLPELRLRLRARRLAAVHQRLPRLHLHRHEPRRAPLRQLRVEPLPVQPRRSSTAWRRTPTAASTRSTSGAASRSASPTSTGRTSSSTATRSSSASTTCATTASSSTTATASWCAPRRSASSRRTRSTPPTSARRDSATSAASTSTTPLYVVVGRDSLNPIAGPDPQLRDGDSVTHPRRHGRARGLVRPRLVPSAPRLLLRHGRPQSARPQRARLRRHLRQRRTSPAAASASSTASASGSPAPASSLVERGSLLPDLRSSKDEGQPNFVNPGVQLATRRRRRRPHAAAEGDLHRELHPPRHDRADRGAAVPGRHPPRPRHRHQRSACATARSSTRTSSSSAAPPRSCPGAGFKDIYEARQDAVPRLHECDLDVLRRTMKLESLHRCAALLCRRTALVACPLPVAAKRRHEAGRPRSERRLRLLPQRHRADARLRRGASSRCTDCHGGDGSARQTRTKRTSSRAIPSSGRPPPTRRAPTPRSSTSRRSS